MNNRAIKKLLSVVLVMAICVSTVFGCLITVNAASTNATYTITADSLHSYADEGKATMTFELESGCFTSGSFTLLKNDNVTHSTEYGEDSQGNKDVVPSPWDYEYNDVEIKVVGGIDVNGNAVSADAMNIDLFYDTNGNGDPTTGKGNDIDEQAEGKDVWCPNNALWFDKPVTEGGTYKDAEGNNNAFVPGPNPAVADGTVFRHKDVKLADVSFSSDIAYQSITLELDFEFAYCMQPNSQNNIRIANSTQVNQDGVAYADPVLKNGEETAGTLSENVIAGNINYLHSHSSNNVVVNGQLLHKNDYSIYTDKCKFCGAVKNQLISDELTSPQPNAYYDISALNIVYEDDGTVSLNLHCPGFQGTKEKLVISYADGKKTIYGDNKTSAIAGNSSFNVSPYAKDKITDEETGKISYTDNVLPFGTYMYEIKGLSAKDIGSRFYLTRIVEGSGDYAGGLFCGHTQEVSLMDYCTDVVEGEKVYYPAGTTEEQIDADKAVAVAFINYGVAAKNALNNKVVAEEKEIVVTDTWDGTKVEPTEIDYAGNIIINNAEELAWVALQGGANTDNKNYKVAANQVFDMCGMTGITIDSTVANVKAATKNNTYKWQTATDDKAAAFKGNFDGNGLVVYNLYSATGRGYSGLFPVTTPATATTPQVIKNVAVCASHIGGYHYAGGIVGLAECNTTSSIVNFENCIVKNSYIYDNDEKNATNRTVGAIVGGLSHNGSTLNNCAAFDNQISAQGVTGGLIGNKSEYGGSITIQNSISVGTSVLPIAGANAVSGKFTGATYKNVYTDVETSVTGITVLDTANMKGSAAVTNMSALDWRGVWVTTDSYPTFNPDILRTDVWDGTFVEPTLTDAEGNIIISTAEELAWIALQGGTATQGKNYKVVENAIFNLNGMAGITLDSTAADVEAATKTSKWGLAADSTSPAFGGNFDGNGLIVYNASGKKLGYNGLFPVTCPVSGGSVTIKNITVVASDFRGYHNAGAIVGLANAPDTSTSLYLENCVVKNCFISDGADGNTACQRTTGTHIGNAGHNKTAVNNCLAIGNKLSGQDINGGFVGNVSGYNTGLTVSNSISIGTNPVSTPIIDALSAKYANAVFTNVYTDQTVSKTGVTTLTTAQMTGTEATKNMALDFGGVWFANTAGVPQLRVFHNITGIDNGNGTHSETCADCGLVGLTVDHFYNIVDYTTDTSSCACGAFIYGTHDVWDGTKANAFDSGSGTEADPYIIKTVEQLFLMVRSTGLNADGTPVYYKVADSVDALYINDTRAYEDQAAFEAAVASLKNWSTGLTTEAQFCGDASNCYCTRYNDVYTSSSTKVLNNHRDGYVDYFGGRFDGNGVTIYGLYSQTTAANHWNNGVGFVPMLTGDAVIKNVTFDTNYVKSNSAAAAVISASAGIWDGQYNRDTNGDGTYETYAMCPKVDAYAKRPENCNAAIINVAVCNSYLGATNYSNNSFVSGFVSSIRAPKSLKLDNCMFDGTNATFVSTATGTKNHVAFVTTQESVTNSVLTGCVSVGNDTLTSCTNNFAYNCHVVDSNEFTVEDAPLLNWTAWEIIDGIPTLKINTSCFADSYRNQGVYDLSWRKNKIITSTDEYEGFDFSKLRNDRGIFKAYNTLTGSGTEADPYIINDADTLYLIIASGGTKLGVPQHFKLGCNIDLEGKQWVDTAIFENTEYDVVFYQYLPFAGTLDGDGHTISNMYTARGAEIAGFIPELASTGVVKNINFRDCYAYSEEEVAIIAGSSEEGATIENCSIESSAAVDHFVSEEWIAYYTYGDATVNNCYVIKADDSVEYSEETAPTLDGKNWYGIVGGIVRSVAFAKAQPCADIDADGVGEEYTTSDATALKNNLLWEDGYDYIYGDVTGNGTIDMRDLAALQRQMTGQETIELDGFWPNVKGGKFSICYNDKDNYDFARKLELYLESKAGVDVTKTFGTSDANFTITLKTEGAANAYSVSYDAQNAKLTITGGSFTAVEEAVDQLIAKTNAAGVPAISGTIGTEKNAVTVDGNTYYYAWGDEFDSDVAGTVSYDKWMTRNKTTDDTPDVVDSDFEGMRDPTDEEAIKINQVKDGKLTLKRGFTGASSGYKYYMSGIGTKDSMLFKQGYLEMVATVPSDGYAFPAWWLLTHTGNKSNEMVDTSLYSKVFELNPAYNGKTRIPTGADVTSFKYKLPTQTLEMDLFEIIQRPEFKSSWSNTVQASTDHNIKFNIHKWYSYSLDKTDTSMTVYNLDWSKNLTSGAFPTKLLTATGSDGENYKKSSSSILFNTDNLAGGGVNGAVTYEGNHDTMQYNMASLRSNGQITERRYGFLWTENEMTFIVYDGTAANAGILYIDTVTASEMNFGGSESYYNNDNFGFGQYAYMLIENHIFTSNVHNFGRGVASGIGECDMVIDYVRIYQLDGARAIITPDSEPLSSR